MNVPEDEAARCNARSPQSGEVPFLRTDTAQRQPTLGPLTTMLREQEPKRQRSPTVANGPDHRDPSNNDGGVIKSRPLAHRRAKRCAR